MEKDTLLFFLPRDEMAKGRVEGEEKAGNPLFKNFTLCLVDKYFR